MKTNTVKRPKQRVRDQARRANQQKHVRRRKKNYTLHYILLSILILVIGITLSVTVFFNTEEIVVEGNVTHSSEELIGYTNVELGDNLFRMNMEKLENSILEHTVDLDEVQVKRQLPSTLVITVTQATPAAAYYGNGAYNIISSSGRVVAQAASLEEYPNVVQLVGTNLTSYALGDYLTDDPNYQAAQTTVAAMQKVGIDNIVAVDASDANNILLSYGNRVTIQLGNTVEVEYKLQMVKKVLEEYVDPNAEGIIDARKPTVAYFRPMTMEKQLADGKAVVIPEAPAVSSEPAASPEPAAEDPQAAAQPDENGDAASSEDSQ